MVKLHFRWCIPDEPAGRPRNPPGLACGPKHIGNSPHVIRNNANCEKLNCLETIKRRQNKNFVFHFVFVIVLTVKTVFKVVAGGITVASTLEVLSRGSTFDQLVSAVNKCVLPAGTSLIQITEGCVCLTVQAENLASLEALWSLYKNGTLRARLQDFFVTEEVREELASGEELEVIVTIEEGEYQKALHELSSEMEGNLLIHDYPVSIFTSKPSFQSSQLRYSALLGVGFRIFFNFHRNLYLHFLEFANLVN